MRDQAPMTAMPALASALHIRRYLDRRRHSDATCNNRFTIPEKGRKQMSEKRTGAQVMCEALIRNGVEVMFGIPGGAIMPEVSMVVN
jgi:hypothetical protein